MAHPTLTVALEPVETFISSNGEGMTDPFGQIGSGSGIEREDRSELLAAEAAEAAFRQMPCQHLSEYRENAVAGIVAIAIVDRLEVIEIEEEAARLPALEAGEEPGRITHEGTPVGRACQRIDESGLLVFELDTTLAIDRSMKARVGPKTTRRSAMAGDQRLAKASIQEMEVEGDPKPSARQIEGCKPQQEHDRHPR